MNELINILSYETWDSIFDSIYIDSLLLLSLMGSQILVPSF